MKTVFADTAYWIALANPRDGLWEQVESLNRSMQSLEIVTTDEVLAEFVTYFRDWGPFWRAKVARLVRSTLEGEGVQVIEQTRESFLSGLGLYEARLDKEYSLTDCISMETMRDRGLADVLTADRHFTQEGFTKLLGQNR
jgi:predicted nucleic acid-binding protein